MIYHTTDGGTHWDSSTVDSETNLRRVAFTSSNNGFLLAGNQIFHTTNGGSHWEVQLDTDEFLLDLCAVDDQNAWVLAFDCHLFNTTNAGATWVRDTIDFQRYSFQPLSVNFSDRLHGIVTADSFVVLTTSDGGSSWNLNDVNFNLGLNKGYINSSNEAWAVGMCGAILHRMGLSGISPTEATPVPSTYSLHPIYPNPFNSFATITYTLPHSSTVDLRVFDLTGREIRSLDHRIQPAGTYRLPFNGQALSTGTYFVQMKVGDYQQTRKMLLIK